MSYCKTKKSLYRGARLKCTTTHTNGQRHMIRRDQYADNLRMACLVRDNKR